MSHKHPRCLLVLAGSLLRVLPQMTGWATATAQLIIFNIVATYRLEPHESPLKSGHDIGQGAIVGREWNCFIRAQQAQLVPNGEITGISPSAANSERGRSIQPTEAVGPPKVPLAELQRWRQGGQRFPVRDPGLALHMVDILSPISVDEYEYSISSATCYIVILVAFGAVPG